MHLASHAIDIAIDEVESEVAHNLFAGGQVRRDDGKTMSHRFNQYESEAFPSGGQHIDLCLVVVLLDMIGNGCLHLELL